jgi:Hint module
MCLRMRRLGGRLTAAAAVAAAAVVTALLAGGVAAQNDPEGSFGPIVRLPIGPVQGAVAGDGTTIYTSSQHGEIYLADIKSGGGDLLNRGGVGQTLADLCLDSREGKTLYGAGRDSGLLFAFNAGGELVRRYALTDAKGHYISSCVQTRYYLFVADAQDDVLYRFDLPDTGPDRGKPPPLADGKRDGVAIAMAGDWDPASKGELGAMSVEWSQLWNETGWVLNSATGKLYTFPLAAKGNKAEMKRVFIDGKQKEFPGATKLLIDSSNEHVMYLAQPGRNAVAVIEVNEKDPNSAKYIRTITSPLIDGPVGLSEFGEWLFVLNAKLGAKDREKGGYTLVQVPKHKQKLLKGYDKNEPFTETGDGEDPPQPEIYGVGGVTGILTDPAATAGKAPVPPLDEARTPDTVKERSDEVPKNDSNKGGGASDFGGNDTSKDGNTFDTGTRNDGGGGHCFPGDATVVLKDGSARRMDQLRIGDAVLASPGVYSRVFMFTHRDSRARPAVVRIHHDASPAPLRLTPGHYLYVNDELTAAGAVRAGDLVRTGSGAPARVLRVSRTRGAGLYNPQTLHGDVVVDGVVASTYTRAVDPRAAAALLAPARAAAALLGARWDALVSWLELFVEGCPRLAALAPAGPVRHGW